MEATVHHAQRYRAVPARRLSRFWLQPLFVIGLTALLWLSFVREAWHYETRTLPPPPEPRASYVILTPADAAKALANMRSSWRAAGGDSNIAQLDMGMFELREEPAPPEFLEQGAFYPGVWRPAAVEPLPLPMLPVTVPIIPDAARHVLTAKPPEPPQGIIPLTSQPLTDAGFSFALPKNLPDRTGECRFHIETDAGGAIIHLLLLSQPNDSSAILERALGRGQARNAARGTVTLMWNFPK